MNLLWGRWTDLPDYIIGITREIWEDRGIETLNRCYAPDIPVRTPMGVSVGNKATMAATMGTLAEFPDRELLAEDVIWCGDETQGFLSSHRILSTGTHTHDGVFGPATGRRFAIRVVADCAVRNGVIDDEWMVRDYGGIARQLGQDPRDVAHALITAEGGADKARRPFRPEADVAGPYQGKGNTNAWGARYAETLTKIMEADFAHVPRQYDRAAIAVWPGAQTLIGARAISEAWLRLRSAFPSARFELHHIMGMEAGLMPPRAAVRWSLTGTHDGWGVFGRPTGAPVHVMGICHAEYGPYGPQGVGLRREFVLFDEVAIWKQVLLHTGEIQ
jgi:predicted ester cyclase